MHPVTERNSVDLGTINMETPSTAISEIAKGLSGVRDALQAMAELAEQGRPVAELAPHEGMYAASVVFAMVGAMEWAGDKWPGVPTPQP
jgi:hypothetical protein